MASEGQSGAMRVRGSDPPFAIDLPDGLELGEMPGVLLVARAPEDVSGSPFRTNLTVVAEELPPDADLAAHAEASLADAARNLPGWRLIDRAPAQVGGRDGERTLATYLVARDSGVDFGRDLSVTVEQWRVVHEGRAWIASASCETGEYGLVCDAWTACAESLRPGGAG
jgi:hypothetical protein